MKLTTLTSTFTLLLLAAFSSQGWANKKPAEISPIKQLTQCQKRSKTPNDYSRCLDAAVIDVTRQVTTWENEVSYKLNDISQINGRKDSLVLLKQSKQTFNKHMEKFCRWQYLALLPEIVPAGNRFKECQIELYNSHIQQLKTFAAIEY